MPGEQKNTSGLQRRLQTWWDILKDISEKETWSRWLNANSARQPNILLSLVALYKTSETLSGIMALLWKKKETLKWLPLNDQKIIYIFLTLRSKSHAFFYLFYLLHLTTQIISSGCSRHTIGTYFYLFISS